MRGERIEQAEVQPRYDIPGDRRWAVREESVGEICSAKKIPGLLQCAASYIAEPVRAATPAFDRSPPWPRGDHRRFAGITWCARRDLNPQPSDP